MIELIKYLNEKQIKETIILKNLINETDPDKLKNFLIQLIKEEDERQNYEIEILKEFLSNFPHENSPYLMRPWFERACALYFDVDLSQKKLNYLAGEKLKITEKELQKEAP